MILNRDESSVYFEMGYKQTLEAKGVQHVGVISEDKEKKRLTVVLTIGHCLYRTNRPILKLPPMIIMKKSKPRNTTLERPASTLYENAEVQELAKREGILVVQSFSG